MARVIGGPGGVGGAFREVSTDQPGVARAVATIRDADRFAFFEGTVRRVNARPTVRGRAA